MVVILRQRKLVLVDVRYFMPDYSNILQEFIWQTEDIVPDIPRVHKFLNYWKTNIDAVISEVSVSYDNNKVNHYRNVIYEVSN